MNINELTNELYRQDIHLTSCGYKTVPTIFNITPHEYLKFMEEDLKNKDKRNIINALSNGKRALDCQIEMLLYSFCMQDYAEKARLNIPAKIMLLNSAGIIAPRILNKINKIRNMMEHDFYCPSIIEVQDFADVILLFICYTDKYLLNVKTDCEIEKYLEEEWYRVNFDRENQKIIVEVIGINREKIELEISEQTKNSYIEFLKRYIEIISEF